MVSQRQQIIDEIQALGLSNSKLVLDSLRPAIRVIASKIDINDQEIGSSRFALIPDLPDSIEWPSWSVPETNCSFEQYIKNHPSPIPLDFIAQINMADLQSFEAAAELPQSGMLYFFYLSFCGPSGFDPTDRGGFKVIFYDGPMDLLRRREPPEGCFKDYAPCALKFDERWTLSNTLELPEPDATVYHDFYFDSSFSEAGDQILGQPYTLQGAMELQCQLTSNGCNTGDATGYSAENLERFGAGERDWRLLLQIDCSDEADWTWGCGDGLVYFWIRKQDLLALNFNDVWLHMQCS